VRCGGARPHNTLVPIMLVELALDELPEEIPLRGDIEPSAAPASGPEIA